MKKQEKKVMDFLNKRYDFSKRLKELTLCLILQDLNEIKDTLTLLEYCELNNILGEELK